MGCRNTVIPEVFRQLIGNLAIGLQTMCLNMKMKNSISDYTEAEFLTFLQAIFNVETSSEEEHKSWVRHFVKLSEHPRGNGLIFYPDNEEDDSPAGILKTVKEWRASQGKQGFKKD